MLPLFFAATLRYSVKDDSTVADQGNQGQIGHAGYVVHPVEVVRAFRVFMRERR